MQKSVLMHVKESSLCVNECIDACKREEPICKSVLMRVKGRSLCTKECLDACKGEESICKRVY